MLPLPPAFRELSRSRRFWTDFLCATTPARAYDELGDVALDLPICEKYSLRVSFDGNLFGVRLELVSGTICYEIGWDDEAHWFPHTLQWREVDALCRAVAANAPDDPDAAHPGIPLLLLARFAPVCSEGDASLAARLLAAAWAPFGDDFSVWFDRIDARAAGFRWVQHPSCDVLEQDDGDWPNRRALYTLRAKGDAEFPFVAFREAVADAEAIAPMHRQPLAPVTPPLALVWVELELSFPRANLPAEAGPLIGGVIDRAWRHRGLGRLRLTTSEQKHGQSIRSVYGGFVRADVHTGLAIAGQCARAFALGDALVIRSPKGASWPEVSEGRSLQAVRLKLVRYASPLDGAPRVRFDTEPLSVEDLASIEQVEGANGARRDGVWTVLEAQDGGRVRWTLGRRDEPSDGATIDVEVPSRGVSHLVWRLCETCNLTLLPAMVVVTRELAGALGTPWPGTQFAESLEHLERLLPVLRAAEG